MTSSSRLLMAVALAALAGCLVLPTHAQDPVPVWQPRFSVNFNESTRILFTRKTTGTWWYDWDAKVEVVERADGNGDRYCGSIHAFLHTPCRHVVKEGNRYLLFPEQGECCLCCTAEHGCGVLKPDWLAGAKYEGVEVLREQSVYKWSIGGLQTNTYYATADDAQLPVELDQLPNDLQSFDTSSFDTSSPIPPELITIPPDCHSYCPISSVCTLLRSGQQQQPQAQGQQQQQQRGGGASTSTSTSASTPVDAAVAAQR